MIKYNEMWFELKPNLYTRQYGKYEVQAKYVWNNQWDFDLIESSLTHNHHLVTLSKDADAEQMDIALSQCITEMALTDYDLEKFSLIPSTPFDSETVGIISIVLLLASMVFWVLGIFVYAFVWMCIITFIMWIVVGIYAMSIKYKDYK